MRAAADEGYTTATAVADALVRRGVPFRVAHHVVGSLVAQAEEAGVGLDAVPDAMIGLALGVAGDATTAALAEDPGIGERSAAAASVEARSRSATSSAARPRSGWRRRWMPPGRGSTVKARPASRPGDAD